MNKYNRDYALTHSVPADNWLFSELLRWLAPLPGWRVLDVGCNTGELTARLDAMQCRTLGLDVNPDAIALARQRFPVLEFSVGTLPDCSKRGFDAIVASHVIEHLPELNPFLQAVRERLKPGGRLVLATPNRHAWLRRAARRLFGLSYFDDPTHVRFYSPAELREHLAHCCFERVLTGTRRLYLPLAGRLPQRLHLAIPACGMGDHLFVSAAAPSAQA